MKFRQYLFTLVLLSQIVSLSFAQSSTPVLDSLQQLLDNTTNPEEQINLLLVMGKRARITQSLAEASTFIDAALEIANEHQKDALIAKLSMEKGKLAAENGDYASAESIFKNALTIYQTQKDNTNILNCFTALGIVNRRKGNYIDAVKYMEQAVACFSDSVSANRKGVVLINLSNVYDDINKEKLAYEKIFEALRYLEEANDTHNIGLLYGNLGLLYRDQGDFKNAVLYYNKSLDILKAEKDLRGQLNAYTNLASLYTFQEDYSTTLEMNQKELEVAQQTGSLERIVVAKISMTTTYLLTNQLQKAKALLSEIGQNIDKISERYLLKYNLSNATLYRKLKDYPKATNYGQEALKIGRRQGEYLDLSNVIRELELIHKANGNFEKAYEYLSEFKAIADTLTNQTNIEALTTQKLQFEFDKKQETFELEKETLKSRLRIQNIFRWAAIIIALLIGIFALFSFRNYRKQNQLLKEDLKNKKIIEQQAERLQSFNTELEKTVTKRTAELNQANYELQTFNYIASHDIKEPIRNIGNFTGLIEKKLPENIKEELSIYFQTIRKSTTQLYTLLEDFARYTSLSKNETVKNKPVDLNDTMDSVVEVLQTTLKERNGVIVNHGLPTVLGNSSLLYTALKNLVENGLKFNKSETPTVELSYQDTPQFHEIHISDNGIGIDVEYHDQIFDMFKKLQHSSDKKGSGIGLAVVKLALDKLGGTIRLESEFGKGSHFIIQLSK